MKSMLFVLLFLLSFSGYVRKGLTNQPELMTTLPDMQQDLVAFIRGQDNQNSRILFESGDEGHPHVADIIPHLTRASMLGGPHPGVFIKTQFQLFKGHYMSGSEFVKGKPIVFGQYLENFREADFAAYLDLYNVERVVSYTSKSNDFLGKFKRTLYLEYVLDRYVVFKVAMKPNWFYKGSGNLSVSYDKLVIDNPSLGEIVLKFHWIKSFKCDPPLPMFPIILKDDPVPFIAIDNVIGAEKITVYNAG